ncbi:MAG: DUF72 domain-containing protein [bacterium]
MIRIGTSGYSYDDWLGHFYPPGTGRADYLSYYSQHFDTCEINFSYYRMPTAQTLGRMLETSAGRVTFTIKLPRTITHDRASDLTEQLTQFTAALAPWREAHVLGGVLAQLPHGFGPDPRSRAYLDAVLDGLRPLPTVVEFRNARWIRQETFAHLTAKGIGMCCVDEPDLKGLLPRLGVVTAPPGYVRFHGRNRDKWYDHEQAYERYDYRYGDDELEEWVPRIQRMSERSSDVYVFFNNHFQAKAISGAKRLQELLAGPGPGPGHA